MVGRQLERIEYEYIQEGLKRLAIAVILHAIRDYHHGDKEARSFLKSDRLDYWCKFAGIAAEVVRQQAFVKVKDSALGAIRKKRSYPKRRLLS
jgi:hypothetical protein